MVVRVNVKIEETSVGEEPVVCFVPTSFTLYHIQVRNLMNHRDIYIIKRRYSEFAELDYELRKKAAVRGYTVPKLPAKQLFCSSSEACVSDRKRTLTDYLTQLVNHTDICNMEALRDFLTPNEEDKKFAADDVHVGDISKLGVDIEDFEIDQPKVDEVEGRVSERPSITTVLDYVEKRMVGENEIVNFTHTDMLRLRTLLKYSEEEYQLQCHKLKVATRELSLATKMLETSRTSADLQPKLPPMVV